MESTLLRRWCHREEIVDHGVQFSRRAGISATVGYQLHRNQRCGRRAKTIRLLQRRYPLDVYAGRGGPCLRRPTRSARSGYALGQLRHPRCQCRNSKGRILYDPATFGRVQILRGVSVLSPAPTHRIEESVVLTFIPNLRHALRIKGTSVKDFRPWTVGTTPFRRRTQPPARTLSRSRRPHFPGWRALPIQKPPAPGRRHPLDKYVYYTYDS